MQKSNAQEVALVKTYISPIRPTYRDIKYMYLAAVGRALAGVASVMTIDAAPRDSPLLPDVVIL